MDLSEFVEKWIGKKCDFDGYAGAQCVDLPRMYWKEVGGVPVKMEPCSTTGGAKDLFNDYDKMPLEKKYLKKVKVPAQGDVAVWNSIAGNSKYGHVAIVLSVFKTWLLVFEQDGFKQDGAKFSYRSKTDILGYLRRR